MEKQTKDTLRKEFLKKRDALPSAERTRDSALIRQRVLHYSDWRNAVTVLIYSSFRTEVDTHKLIQEALALKKRVVMPVADRGAKEIGLSELQAYGDLAPGAFEGIYEPGVKYRKRVDPSEINVILAPGVAFDRQGGRLGYGGGYFDKLFSQMPQVRRIGLAFAAQISAQPLPMDIHDVRMEIVITEKEVINIR